MSSPELESTPNELEKPRRGFKCCSHCSKAIPAASKTCPLCNSILHPRTSGDKVKRRSAGSSSKGGSRSKDKDTSPDDESPVARAQGTPPSSSGPDEAMLASPTAHSRLQPSERLDLPPFEREDPDDGRVMVEVPAGSNAWYQAFAVAESATEMHLRFPGTRKALERLEWIDKRSTRLSRLGLATRLWKFIKGSDGAWCPKGTEPPAEVAGRKIPRKQGASAGGGHDTSSGKTSTVAESSREGGPGERHPPVAAEPVNPLAEWFKVQRELLLAKHMVLPGSAESGALVELKPRKSEGGKDGKIGKKAGGGARGGREEGLRLHSEAGGESTGWEGGGGGDRSKGPGGQKGNRPKIELPPRQYSVLEEDDLFNGGGPAKQRTFSGSGINLPPMNSFALPPKPQPAAPAPKQQHKLPEVLGSARPGADAAALPGKRKLQQGAGLQESGASSGRAGHWEGEGVEGPVKREGSWGGGAAAVAGEVKRVRRD